MRATLGILGIAIGIGAAAVGIVFLLRGVLQATEIVYRGFLVVRPALQWMFRAPTSTRTRS